MANHWSVTCQKLHMETNHKEISDSPGSSGTPGGDQDSKATGEGESKYERSDRDEDTYVSDCRRGQRTCRGSSNKKKRWKNKKINIGTWNVRTMREMGKLQLLLQELKTCQINITGLCEVRWSNEGLFTSGDHTIVYCGNDRGTNGVAIVLDKKHAGCLKSYNTINDRIVTVKLNTRPVVLNIIQVYAPTSTSTDDDIETFYNDLQAVIDKIPKREVCVVMGDLNAKIGEGDEPESGVGPFGLGERNERGDMLASFCQTNEFVITNTIFQQPLRRRYTWISPGDKHKNQIDYILINKEWRSTVLNSKSRPGADCDTDHILLTAQLRLKTYKQEKAKIQTKFDTDQFKDPAVRIEYGIEIKNRFQTLLEDWTVNEKPPNELWEEMKKIFTEVADEKVGRRSRKPTKTYISDEVLELAKEKSKARKENNHEEYKRLKRDIQCKIRRDKKTWLEEECAKINECNEERRSKELFEQIKKVQTGKFKPRNHCINDKDGHTLTEPEEVLKRWHEYGSKLFGLPQKTGIKDSYKVNPDEIEPKPLMEEVEAAVRNLKRGKSPGLDNIPGELIKHSGETGIKAIHHLCCEIWNQQEWPNDWKLQEFVMLHKSGSAKDCGNYRTIALISHASKILLIIILNRMKKKVEQELSDCQAGYRMNRGTTDMLFVLQIIIEKIRDSNAEGFITFIDYSKAFDSVIHSQLLEVMTKMGFQKHLTSLIASLYQNQKATIRWNYDNCAPFNIEKGVRQGCILSPHLFNVYTEQIMREADIDGMGLNIGGRDMTNLRYADDTALLSDNLTSMKRILHRVDTAGKRAGLQLNAKKTKVMHISGRESSGIPPDIKINQTSLENVDQFKYLGSIKTTDGTCRKDIVTRIGMAKQRMVQLNNIWKDRSIPTQLKVKILKCLVWPKMLYGCETWTTKKADDNKIEAAEMWFYRRLLRVKWTERRTNESVLQELGTMRMLSSIINKRKLKYIGHASRNQNTQLMKQVFQGKIQSQRKKGRPSASYINSLNKSLGLKLQSISRDSQDREKWKQIVWSTCAAANIEHDDADR